MTTKAKAKRPAARKTGKRASGVLRVDLLARMHGLDGEAVVRQEGEELVPVDLRFLAKVALDQKSPPGESKSAMLRRGDLLQTLRGTKPVDLEDADIRLIEDAVLTEWTPIAAHAVREALGLAPPPGGKPSAGSFKVNLDAGILDPADRPQMRRGPGGEVALTVRHAIRVALNQRPTGGRTNVMVDSKGRLQGTVPREEMIHRGELIRRLAGDSPVHVDIDDIKLIEDCVHKHSEPSVLHAVRLSLRPVASADDAKYAA